MAKFFIVLVFVAFSSIANCKPHPGLANGPICSAEFSSGLQNSGTCIDENGTPKYEVYLRGLYSDPMKMVKIENVVESESQDPSGTAANPVCDYQEASEMLRKSCGDLEFIIELKSAVIKVVVFEKVFTSD